MLAAARRHLLPLAALALLPQGVAAEYGGEITPQSQQALADGLEWLARNQGGDGNWGSDDLGLVSTGVLAFLADGHHPGRGPFGENVQRALSYVLTHAQPSGLLNIADPMRATYNHGLSTFVLGQAYGTTLDERIGPVLDRALKLIVRTQAADGGWDYFAERKPRGHDLSLAVMQALALRSAVDVGLEVPPQTVRLAIESVRAHYTPQGCPPDAEEDLQRQHPGQFTYTKNGPSATLAMAAAGVVCLQEFGQYDDWRIEKNMAVISQSILGEKFDAARQSGRSPFDAYTLYYLGQALYQAGPPYWRTCYPRLRDAVVAAQVHDAADPARDGMWAAAGRVAGKPGELYMTAVACFLLAIPNRYLPILQEGRIGGLLNRTSRNHRGRSISSRFAQELNGKRLNPDKLEP